MYILEQTLENAATESRTVQFEIFNKNLKITNVFPSQENKITNMFEQTVETEMD